MIGPSGPPDPGRTGCGAEGSPRRQTRPNDGGALVGPAEVRPRRPRRARTGHRQGRRRHPSSFRTYHRRHGRHDLLRGASGNLLWYKDLAPDGTDELAPNNGAVIGTGWDKFTQVLSGGDGVLYAIDRDGNLRWYKDTHRDGTLMDGHVPNQGATIGILWGSFTQVFSGGNGVLYAIDVQGDLHWYKDTHRDGTQMDRHVPNQGAIIGVGWDRFTTVFSTGNGVIFARNPAGYLFWYKDLSQHGTSDWDPGSSTRVGSGFDPTSLPLPLLRRGQCRLATRVIYAIDRGAELRFFA